MTRRTTTTGAIAALALLASAAPLHAQGCPDCDGNGMSEADERAAGSGLVAQYYNGASAARYDERVAVRIDQTIAFNWQGGSPDPAVTPDNFAVRWTGTLIAPVSGTYTFYTTTDDGVRLWLDDTLLINKWQPQSPTTWSATIALVAGQRVPLRMDYYEGGGGAEAKLEWQAPGIARQVVPASALGPVADADGDGWPDACGDCDGDGVANPAELALGTDSDCNGNCVLDSCEIAQTATLGYWRFENDAATIADSGPFGLTGVPTSVSFTGSVAVPVVPATVEPNVRAAALGSAGRVLVNDADGVLSSGGGSFTIEAWVKLDTLAGGVTALDRHVIVQRKALASGDKFADYIFFAQGGDMPLQGFANYGRGSGLNGRELVLLFGNGGAASASFWTVTSNLRIEDNAWHYVSVSFDAERSEVRFVRDASVEHIAVVDGGHVSVQAPVLVGVHTNATGALNQPLEGRIDELRISAGVLDPTQLLSRAGGGDCNLNGLPDACDIAAGNSADCNRDGIPNECEPDCNANGSPDACDIAGGFSADCNGDGIPDDCQLAGNDCDADGIPDGCQLADGDCDGNGLLDRCEIASGKAADCNADGTPDVCQAGEPFDYRIDDGGPEFGIRSLGTHMAWLTGHRVERGAGLIEAIDIMFVFMPAGATATVGLWSDPNGDGNPGDAQLLASKVVPTAPLGVMQTVDIADTLVGPDGTSFFIGAWAPVGANDFPGALDTSRNAVLGRCWLVGKQSPIDPNDLAGDAAAFETIEQALFPGKWVMRAKSETTEFDCNANGVLDSCDIAAGTSVDSDGSGRPDECEDCNANGVLDSLDIAAGTSGDCDADGVPDECRLAGNDCNANGVPDACELGEADCNGNGVPDACDIASGSSDDTDASGRPDECEDCNANGVLDSADIAGGTSEDCNADLVPDECQLGEPPLDIEYLRDDGTREGNYGAGGVVDFVWLNQYEVAAGGEWIARVSVILGNAFSGVPYRVALWSDPDGDGDPTDAQVIATADAVAANGNTNVFNEIDVPPTYIGPAGTSFFAGVIFRDGFGNQFPLAIDNNSVPLQRSWVSIGDPIDPNNLSNATIFGYLINDNALVRAYGFDGALPDDCNGNGTPDACDIADGTAADANSNGIPDCCETGNGCGPCAGDLDGNGVIEAPDLSLLLGAWGGKAGDIDGDGATNAADLALLLGAWGACR